MTRGDPLWFNLCLPEALARLRLHLRYRGQLLDVEITPREAAIRLGLGDQRYRVSGGDTLKLALAPPRQSRVD